MDENQHFPRRNEPKNNDRLIENIIEKTHVLELQTVAYVIHVYLEYNDLVTFLIYQTTRISIK